MLIYYSQKSLSPMMKGNIFTEKNTYISAFFSLLYGIKRLNISQYLQTTFIVNL